MFYLKKVISACLLPLPIILVILLIGIICLYFNRLQKLGRILVILGFVILLFISLPMTSNLLVTPLESQYSPMVTPPKHIRYIVVLGGGNYINPHAPSTNLLTNSSLKRLIEGIRLHQLIPGSELVLSGGSYLHKKPNAVVMADVAETLGISKHAIIIEKQSLDTYQEAKLLKPLLEQKPFILVTSAVHMPRSMKLFEQFGMNPIAAPCDYQAIIPKNLPVYFPRGSHISAVESAQHEYLGLLAAKLTGKIN